MGRSCTRRSRALRVPHSGRRTGRTELEHHFEETRELSKSARWISPGQDRALRQARRSAVAPQRWDRTEPIENRSYNREREKLSRRSKGIRNFRRLSLDLRRRRADPESLAHLGPGASAHRRIRRSEPGSVATRIQICRLNDLL